MKQILMPTMLAAMAFTSINAYAVSASSLPMTDFQNGTTSGWHIGPNGDGAVQVTVGQESGGNSYLKYTASGVGHDSRIALMAGNDYRGNYNAIGVKSISTRMKNNSSKALNMHIAFGNGLADLRSRYATTGVEVANDGEWHDVVFSLTEALHFVPQGGHGSSSAQFSADEVLANIVNLRFTQGEFGVTYHDRRGPFNGYNAGEELEAELWIDDIQLSTDLSSADVSSVPVPAAMWLFSSAIAGLAVSRKRTI